MFEYNNNNTITIGLIQIILFLRCKNIFIINYMDMYPYPYSQFSFFIHNY